MIAIFILLHPFICLDFESILEDVIRKQVEYYKLVSFKVKVNTLMFNDEFDYEERNNKLTHQWYNDTWYESERLGDRCFAWIKLDLQDSIKTGETSAA